MVSKQTKGPARPRYQRSGLAAEALRKAVRRQVVHRNDLRADGQIDDKERQFLQNRVGNRVTALQQNRPTASNMNSDLWRRFQNVKGELQGQRKPAEPKDPKEPNPPASPAQPNQDQAPAAPTSMQITPNGQLDLPYNPHFANTLLDAQTNLNQQLLGLQMQSQQQGLEFERLKRDAGIDYKNLARQTLNKYAGRGMAFSSGYGNQVSENSNDYNNYMNDLSASDALFKQGIGSQRTGLEAALNEMIRRASLGYAQDLEGQAGDLGYGQSVPQITEDAPNMPNSKSNNSSSNTKSSSSSKNTKQSGTNRKVLRGAFRRDILDDKFNGKNLKQLSDAQRKALTKRITKRMEKTDKNVKNVKDKNVKKIYRTRKAGK